MSKATAAVFLKPYSDCLSDRTHVVRSAGRPSGHITKRGVRAAQARTLRPHLDRRPVLLGPAPAPELGAHAALELGYAQGQRAAPGTPAIRRDYSMCHIYSLYLV